MQSRISRRGLMLCAAAASVAAAVPAVAETRLAIHVLKDPNCGCCSAWIDILENDGFAVTTEPSAGTLLMRYKADNGIPQTMISCHTGRIDGYLIEGHVPVAGIRRLLDERPDAVGWPSRACPTARPAWVRKARGRPMTSSSFGATGRPRCSPATLLPNRQSGSSAPDHERDRARPCSCRAAWSLGIPATAKPHGSFSGLAPLAFGGRACTLSVREISRCGPACATGQAGWRRMP